MISGGYQKPTGAAFFVGRSDNNGSAMVKHAGHHPEQQMR